MLSVLIIMVGIYYPTRRAGASKPLTSRSCLRPNARNSICITDYEVSLRHDTALIRSHEGTPRHVNIYGYFYDIDTGTLTEVIRDIPRIDPTLASSFDNSRLQKSSDTAWLGRSTSVPADAC
jgi:hypothetical protein